MDTSVTIIGLVITLLIATPLFFVFRSNMISKNKIKTIKEAYSKNNTYNYELTEILNNKVMNIDENKKAFLFMDFNYKEEYTAFVDLNTISSCDLVVTTKNPKETIVKIEFEFKYKNTDIKEFIPIYTIENDQINQIRLYEEHQLAKKWKAIIDNCISK
ncbi:MULTISPECIES: hypothetical protein [unclassified Flavobacterium]|uniref:hypothetical protein n=1 Tax=unclassified Flavobacterium TaxID=196869 RepID=UPI001570B617|nr:MULTISPECIES: hypothetical protein [unclassified Flavobacterium]MBE0390460.1 hypothetical protein [Flavobacterium sp. PL002]NRT15550.1 hypothetical protein [Flavobacterium sp. 28A]